MEYMENTFKMRKETKHDTILHKAKEPKGEKVHHQAKSGQAYGEKGPKPKPNDLQMVPNFTGMAYTSLEVHQTKLGPRRHL
jgi:hypothetical protein